MLSEDLIALILKTFPQGICAIDLETTGLSALADKIVEVACLKVDKDGKVSTFERLVNPEKEIPEKVIAIHHITNEMVVDSPKFSEVADDLLEFLGNYPIVAHNAHYDMSFIIHQLLSAKKSLPQSEVYCSYFFARSAVKNLKSYKLSELIKHYNLAEDNSHRALDDSKACLHVFAKILEYVDGDDIRDTVRDKAFLLSTKDYLDKDIWEIPNHLQILTENLLQAEKYEIRYMGGSMRNKWRPIIPQSFLPLPSGMILKAQCLISNDIKSFVVKKIAEARKPPSQS